LRKILGIQVLNIIFAEQKYNIMGKFDRSNISDVMHWFGLVTIATYFGLGLYIMLTSNLNYMDKNVRFVFSFFFIAFGFFRGVRWLQKHKSRKYYEDTDDRNF